MKIGDYKQMMAYLTRPEQPKEQVADLVDDLTPGPLKDELTKDYDPSQESYEEYLQRKALGERPFNAQDGGRANLAIGGGVIKGNDLGTREGFQKPKKTYTKYEDGKDYDKLKPATPDEQIKIKEEFNKRYNLLKKGKIGVEELFPKVIAKVVYNLPEVKQASDFTSKTRQFLNTLDVYNNEIAPQLKSISAGVGKKKPGMVDLGYTGQPGATILRDEELRAEVKKLAEKDKLAAKAISQILQDKYPGQGGLSLTQVKAAVRGLIEEGDIDANKVRPSGGQKLTVEEATERTKILKNLILNTNLGISEIQNKVMSPLGGQTSRSVILDTASDLLTDKQLAKRFKSINSDFMNDLKVLDKIIKTPSVQKVINNEDLSKRDRFRFLTEEFSKTVNKPIGSVIGRFNDRLTALGSVYSGTKYYDSKSLDKILTSSITPIKNYSNSNLQKNLIAINSSIKGLNNIDTARMIGISDENIDTLRKSQQASKAAFPGFVLQGDHTDIKSLMSNFDDYKDNFMRIQFIKQDLNLWKSSYDREIVRLFNLAKQGETIDPKTNLPINDAVQNKVQEFKTKTGGYDLGEFFVDKKGNITINPKTPVISNLDAPINQTLKQTALNLQTYSKPGGKTEVLDNKFDQEYLAAETTDERTAVLEKYKDSKVTKGSKILKGLSNVPGPVGRATKTFLAGGAIVSPFVITSIASADTPTQEMPIQETPTQVTPIQEEPIQVTPKQKTKEGLPPEAALAGVATYKYGPQLLKILKSLGSGAFRTFGSPLVSSLYGASEILDYDPKNEYGIINPRNYKVQEDPDVRMAGLSLLLPDIAQKVTGPAATSAATGLKGFLSKAGRIALNPYFKAARLFTPVGLGIAGVGQAYDFYKQYQDLQKLKEEDPEAYEKFRRSRVDDEITAQEISTIEDMGREGAMYGGRMGFADGPEDPGKRKTMKILAGLASLPIVGRFFDVAQVAEKAAPAVVETFKNAPAHFIGLVNKIRALGRIIDPKKLLRYDKEKFSNVYDYGDYRMYEKLDGGVEIQKEKWMGTNYGDAKVSEEYMSYNPKTPKFNKKGEKIPDEYEEVYEEYTAYPDSEGKMKDVYESVEPETIDEGTYSKEELEQLIVEQIEDSIKKGKK
jgi:hypothetical protein